MKATRRPAPSSPANVAPVGDDVLQFVPDTDLEPVNAILKEHAALMEYEGEDPEILAKVEALPSIAEMVRAANKKRLDALPPEVRALRLSNPSGSAKWQDAA